MSETLVSCPICGSTNPASATKCETCQADLLLPARSRPSPDGIQAPLATAVANEANDRIASTAACRKCGFQNPVGALVCAKCRNEMIVPGAVIAGRYEIQSLLGRGGMGTVYRAHDRTLDEVVAIKTLRPEVAVNPDNVRRLQSEIKLSRKVRHRNVAGIHEFGDDNGLVYVVMEVVEGRSVSDLIRSGSLTTEQNFNVAIQASEGLAAIHEANIVHRDFKSSNLMLDSRGVRVLDFGIAKAVHGSQDSAITATGQIMGSPQYMSPEQITGSAVDIRSDLYSLGIVIFELFQGRPPFSADSPMATLMKHMQEPPPLQGEEAARIPRAVLPIVERLLQKKPEERYQNATEVARLLREAKQVELEIGETQSMELPPLSLDDSAGGSTTDAFAPDQVTPPSATRAPGTSAAPPDDASATRPAESPVSGPWSALEGALPAAMRDSRELLQAFLDKAFTSCSRIRGGLIRLQGVRLTGLEEREYFALFMTSESAEKKLSTQTFVAYASPLENYLKAMPEGNKIVVVVTESRMLGGGVRQKILEYREDRNALVVPIHLGEIRDAKGSGRLLELFKRRLKEYHSQLDLFSSRGPLSDATTFFGMGELLNGLVKVLHEPDVIAVVSGPPGSGKSSILKMARYDMEDSRFLTLRCSLVVKRTAADFVDYLVRKLRADARLPASPEDAPGASPAGRLAAVFTDLASAAAKSRSRTIVILEDADWVIDGLCSSQAPEGQAAMRELWGAIAEQSATQGVTIVVSSARGFVLEDRRIAEWDNPLSPVVRMFRVIALSLEETREMVRDLGKQMNVEFEPRAVERLWHVTAGNVDVVRRLCSEALRFQRLKSEQAMVDNATPLSRLVVTEGTVSLAAAELAVHPGTFDHLVSWLSAGERELLRLIAELQPRSIGSLARYTQASTDDLRERAERLHSMGVVTRSGGLRERPIIPLLQDWLRHNVSLPADFERARAVWRTRLLAAAVASLAVVGAALGARFQAARSRSGVIEADGCRYSVDYPKAAADGSEVRVRAFRTGCTGVPPQSDGLTLMTDMSTDAMSGKEFTGAIRIELPCQEPFCARDAAVRLVSTSSSAFGFTLSRGQPPMTIEIRRDPWSRIPAFLSQITSTLLTGLGTVSSFIAVFEKIATAVQAGLGGLLAFISRK